MRDVNDQQDPRSRRLTRARVGAVAATAAVAAGGWLALDGDSDRNTSQAAGATAANTAEVRRTTLTRRESVSGTLGYAGSRSLVHRQSAAGDDSGSDAGSGSGSGDDSGSGQTPGSGFGSGSGSDSDGSGSSSGAEQEAATLTGVAPEGRTVERNGVLYEVNGEAVRLLYGTIPMYRTLAEGIDDGDDVAALESNLAALGYDPGTVDDHFDSSTKAAVAQWQEDMGAEVTGKVELGQVVFAPGPRRIGDVKVDVGTVLGDGTEVMETTSTRRVVSVDLDTNKQSLARKGDGVVVTLPSGRTVRGRITRVGKVAEVEQDGGSGDTGEGGGDEDSTISVTVTLKSARAGRRLDRAPVSVGLAAQVKKKVLAVPVTALLAQVGGGYAVQVQTESGIRTIRVKAGLFADGLVEVSGRGLREGMKVVIPDEL